MPIKPENKNLYPKNWKSISLQIRKEASNKCEACGAMNGLPNPRTGSRVVLTVAHLNGDPTDNRRDNLKALCQACHFAHDRERNVQSMKETNLKKKEAEADKRSGGRQRKMF